MKRGPTTVADMLPTVIRDLLRPKKRKKPAELVDPVEHDYTQITIEEAKRRFAELRAEIEAGGEEPK